MSEFIHLLGAEHVRSAGHSFVSAAETISRAASTIGDPALLVQLDFIVSRFVQAVDRFELAAEKLNADHPITQRVADAIANPDGASQEG